MDLYLNGKTALVTGASQGIGRAIVKQLAAEGVKVFATGRNLNLLNSLQAELNALGYISLLYFSRTCWRLMDLKISRQPHCRH